MFESRSGDSAGPGLPNLARAAGDLGVSLEETNLLEGEAARQAHLRKGRQRFVWASNGRDLYLSVPTPRVAVRLDLGRRHADEPVYRTFRGVPMYLADPVGEPTRPLVEATRRWVGDPANVALIEELDLKRGEWASFGANWSLAQLRARDGDEDQRRVDVALRIVEAATDASAPWLREPRLHAAALPERFRDLAPVIRSWAIDDDGVRSDRMTRARTRTLMVLWSAVGPRLDEIGEYLDSPRLTEKYEVLKLARLAEAAAEARMELEGRGVDVDAK